MRTNRVICGDSAVVLQQIPDESIDEMTTDPPYGIGFMGKEWDTFNGGEGKSMNEFFLPIWHEALRVLKPGAFAFVMCIPRADVLSKQILLLQSAGFDMSFSPIYHTFAAGFPKAHNVSRDVDAQLNVERKVVGKEIIDVGIQNASMHANRQRVLQERDKTVATSIEARVLEGAYVGFQPKPAVEVVLVCMKPIARDTLTNQSLGDAKGVTWMDDARIPYAKREDPEKLLGGRPNHGRGEGYGFKPLGDAAVVNHNGRFPANLLVSDDVLNDGTPHKNQGHFSYKFNSPPYEGGWESMEERAFYLREMTDGSFSRFFSLDLWWEARLKQMPASVRRVFPFLIVSKAAKAERNRGVEDHVPEKERITPMAGRGQPGLKCRKCGRWKVSGNPCRCAEPDFVQVKFEHENTGNPHPTVKPVKLMSYLITLGSREGDVVLDPFAGTCTTAIAAKLLKRRYIMVEADEEYARVGSQRLKAWA